MVDNKIVQIIHKNLEKYVEIEDIKFLVDNGVIKYVLNIQEYHFEVSFYYIDKFYRIRMERICANQCQEVIFLTKSKRFQKDIKLVLKDFHLSKKSFENHMNGFSIYLRKMLENHNNLMCLDESYRSDLKFDGIFV